MNVRLCITLLFFTPYAVALPPGFVYLKEVAPSIIQDMRYFTANDFMGRPVAGYQAPACILTQQAAQALEKVQQQLNKQSMGLKVYDCYRPQMAVDDFITWSQDIQDQKMKTDYYPRVNKSDFFKLGYVAEKSSHTRGSTADLTIVRFVGKSKKPVELAMGTHFDFIDESSHPDSDQVSSKAQKNRQLLRQLMQQAGFSSIETEWWHFTLKDEPFPNTYFNFPITKP